MTRQNPRRYDTTYFDFTYDDIKDKLTVKLKNEDVQSSTLAEDHYQVYIGQAGPVMVEIFRIFNGEQKLPVHSHVHRLGQIFTPWFKANYDARPELEYGLHRFYALHAYDMLDKSPSAFEYALQHSQELLDGTLQRLPDLIERHATLKAKLSFNYQDKGVHTGRGTTIFDTREAVWIMFETTEQNPDKPEYLWDVSEFSPQMEFVTSPLEAYATNQACFALIMDKQKALYGFNIVDLDKIEKSAAQIQGIITQLELILDIPFEKSSRDQLDVLLGA